MGVYLIGYFLFLRPAPIGAKPLGFNFLWTMGR
jgi:hypothetical protein